MTNWPFGLNAVSLALSATGEIAWWTAALGLLLGIVGSAVASALFQRALNRRLRQLRSLAGQIAALAPMENASRPGQDELGALAASLHDAGNRTGSLAQRLKIEQAHREAILSSMADGALAVNDDRRVLFFNEAFARAIGVRWRPAANVTLLELVRDPDLIEMISEVLASGRPSRRRLSLAAAEGRTFDIQVTPILAAVRGAVAVLHELSDMVRVERLRKDFVVNVSHELRTPLAAIQGYTETLLDGAIEDPNYARRFVQIIGQHADRLHNLALNLLTLAELESGQLGSEAQIFPVSRAIDASLAVVEMEAKLGEVALVRGLIEDVQVFAHRPFLEQAMINLLRNAIKFNHPGGEVRIECSRLTGDHAEILVQDTGIGIAAADQPRIFERFYRVDQARSRETGGSGLGLSIARHAIKQMGGTISVQSQLGRGSKFAINLPGLAEIELAKD